MISDKERKDNIKRTLRNLKKTELRIRFCEGRNAENSELVWDIFFDASGKGNKSSRYSISDIIGMNKEEYKAVIEEFYWNVYYRLFKENYYSSEEIYDTEALNKLGLPPYAGFEDIKTRFRQLAKKHHPDKGGNKEEFIELYKIYEELKNKY